MGDDRAGLHGHESVVAEILDRISEIVPDRKASRKPLIPKSFALFHDYA
jgi:hypothetical protein